MTEKTCVSCGKPISPTAVRCPNCGHLTAYGKEQQDQLPAKPTNLDYIRAGLLIAGLIVFIIGLSQFADHADAWKYYAAFKPTEARGILTRIAVGFVLFIAGSFKSLLKILKSFQKN